jgi:8-oxo-dGTP pyrophosphatase MutT (NUDIX family)
VVVRLREAGGYEVAVIKPAGRNVLALPKGHIDKGETSQQTAEREVFEETGLTVEAIQKIADVKYVFRFRGQTIFKVVGFYLFRWKSGDIDSLQPAMRVEVDVARWIHLGDAPKLLSYPGEKDIALKALKILEGPKREDEAGPKENS